jgi:hypothetical protein
MTCLVSPNFDQFLNKWRVSNIIFSSYGSKHIFSLCNDTKVMFIWNYNLPRLYNAINFELKLVQNLLHYIIWTDYNPKKHLLRNKCPGYSNICKVLQMFVCLLRPAMQMVAVPAISL